MTLQKNHKIILLIVALLLLSIAAYAIYNSYIKPKPSVPGPKNTTVQQPGLLTQFCKTFPSLCSALGQGSTSNPCVDHPYGLDANGNCCQDCCNGCLSSRPGYDCDGNQSANC